jgi:hypothetical protein
MNFFYTFDDYKNKFLRSFLKEGSGRFQKRKVPKKEGS